MVMNTLKWYLMRGTNNMIFVLTVITEICLKIKLINIYIKLIGE